MPEAVGETAVVRTIDAIYAAAVAPDHWMSALEQLRATFRLSFAAFVVSNSDRSKVDGIAAGVDGEGYQAFLAEFYRDSPYLKDDKPWYSGQIIATTDLVDPRAFQRSRMYREYWRPNDMQHGVRMAVARDENGTRHAINLLRPASDGVFDARDMMLAGTLMPHLQRAIDLNRRLRQADLLASAALAVMDTLPHALLLLDQGGRVMHANAMAEALVSAGDGLGMRAGVLQAAGMSLTARLHAMLTHAVGSPGRAGSMRLARPSACGAYMALAMPFRPETHWSLPRRPAALLCVTDPELPSIVPGRALAELFGLTGAEAALAVELVAGRSLAEIARRRGRSINTMRSHLAALMGKTGVRRQGDLVRVLVGLPRGFAGG